jgi:hypothetical protein
MSDLWPWPFRVRTIGRGVTAVSLALLALGLGATAASAATTPMVDLGDASTYAVLSGASVGNTVSPPAGPHTILRGDLGVKAASEPTGFPPGIVTGTTRVGTPEAAAAHDAVAAAYAEVANRTGGSVLAGAMAGATIPPGLHTVAGAASNTTTVTLDAGGDPDAVFVFQINGALSTAAGSQFVLAGGAQASRVFWQVNGAGAIGANASFVGTLMALDAVGVGALSVVNGRAFALTGALTLDANEFYSSPPVVTIDGGAALSTNDSAPTISGTTDVEAPAQVTVTVADQTLLATPSAGEWSVTSALLANATYTVLASVVDGAGNVSKATQELTVDTVLPVITIDGGASVATNDPTPTLSGTTDASPGTVVRVGVDAQTLTALVQPTGVWNVTAAALPDGTRTVTASVTDPAGNDGTQTQSLTVDTAAPFVTIAGGATASTDALAPTLMGSSDAAPGTTVAVSIAGHPLTTALQADGTWTVTSPTIGPGTWQVVALVSDPAGNVGSAGQTLTITAPVVSPAPADPTPAPAPLEPLAAPLPIAPAPPAPEVVPPVIVEKFPAKLQVLRAGIGDGRLDVLARITARATGRVDVSYESSGRTTRFTAAIADGTVRIDHLLPRAQRRKTTGIVTIEYAGNDRVRSDDVRLRAASGKAVLRRGVTRIDAKHRLLVAGTTSLRALGVVRVRLGYTVADGTARFLDHTARIRSGRWSLSAALPTAARAGGQLSIQYTGYEPRAIRGEQLAKAVSP